jgi:HSP20 family protein
VTEPSAGQDAWVPAVETEEEGDAYQVRAELPGMRREDVNVELGGGELRITGEIREETSGPTLRRRQGRFAYRTTLPADADTEKAEAHLADGVLTVRLPKTGQTRSRKIEITD